MSRDNLSPQELSNEIFHQEGDSYETNSQISEKNDSFSELKMNLNGLRIKIPENNTFELIAKLRTNLKGLLNDISRTTDSLLRNINKLIKENPAIISNFSSKYADTTTMILIASFINSGYFRLRSLDNLEKIFDLHDQMFKKIGVNISTTSFYYSYHRIYRDLLLLFTGASSNDSKNKKMLFVLMKTLEEILKETIFILENHTLSENQLLHFSLYTKRCIMLVMQDMEYDTSVALNNEVPFNFRNLFSDLQALNNKDSSEYKVFIENLKKTVDVNKSEDKIKILSEKADAIRFFFKNDQYLSFKLENILFNFNIYNIVCTFCEINSKENGISNFSTIINLFKKIQNKKKQKTLHDLYPFQPDDIRIYLKERNFKSIRQLYDEMTKEKHGEFVQLLTPEKFGILLIKKIKFSKIFEKLNSNSSELKDILDSLFLSKGCIENIKNIIKNICESSDFPLKKNKRKLKSHLNDLLKKKKLIPTKSVSFSTEPSNHINIFNPTKSSNELEWFLQDKKYEICWSKEEISKYEKLLNSLISQTKIIEPALFKDCSDIIVQIIRRFKKNLFESRLDDKTETRFEDYWLESLINFFLNVTDATQFSAKLKELQDTFPSRVLDEFHYSNKFTLLIPDHFIIFDPVSSQDIVLHIQDQTTWIWLIINLKLIILDNDKLVLRFPSRPEEALLDDKNNNKISIRNLSKNIKQFMTENCFISSDSYCLIIQKQLRERLYGPNFVAGNFNEKIIYDQIDKIFKSQAVLESIERLIDSYLKNHFDLVTLLYNHLNQFEFKIDKENLRKILLYLFYKIGNMQTFNEKTLEKNLFSDNSFQNLLKDVDNKSFYAQFLAWINQKLKSELKNVHEKVKNTISHIDINGTNFDSSRVFSLHDPFAKALNLFLASLIIKPDSKIQLFSEELVVAMHAQGVQYCEYIDGAVHTAQPYNPDPLLTEDQKKVLIRTSSNHKPQSQLSNGLFGRNSENTLTSTEGYLFKTNINNNNM